MTSKVGIDNSSYVFSDSLYTETVDNDDCTGPRVTDKRNTSSFFKYINGIDDFFSRFGDDSSNKELICAGCCNQAMTVLERVYSYSQEQARSYAIAIHEYQINYPNYELGVDHPPSERMYTSPIPYSQLKESGTRKLLKHIKDIESQRIETRRKIEEELVLIANMESEVISLDEDISHAVSHSNMLGHEINLLNSDGGLSVLFDLDILPHSSKLSFTSTVSTEGEGVPVPDECIKRIATVNGMRLMYLPSPLENLNWAEINRAWSCLSLLVLCLRHKGKLEEAATIVVETNRYENSCISDTQKMDDKPTEGSTLIRFKLQPLRRRTLILLSLEHHLVEEENEIIEEVLCLHGEDSGSALFNRTNSTKNDDIDNYNNPDKFYAQTLLSSEQYQRYAYYQAVIAIAAVVWITARDLGRDNCLTEAIKSIDLSPLLNPPSTTSLLSNQHMENLVNQLCYSIKNLVMI
mmetsp:Transcript_26480/g.25353  ORF Transcript_26480/g.25353 Transcript_26480/m.25353 type:complete len:464 (+) Transcript_26480:149-1540(+)